MSLEPAETSDYNKYDYLFENASNKREKEESEVEMNFSDTSDDENMDEVNCDADGNAWNTKVAATTTTVLPSEITQMQSLWAKIVENTSEKMLGEYKTNLKGILIGRKSCLTPIGDLVPGFPADLLPTHDQLYTLLCQSSGAFPFKNHQGSKLVSRLWLADKSQIGAHLLLECLSQNVLAFDVLSDSEICESIQTYIGMKDLLGDSFHKQKDGTTSMDFPDSLVERLLKVD
uniref:Uncharacterized protein n=1 Tax=Caenorhabditis japonica TaxID=281687 RepID=A0A8R1I4B3_CAEJA